MIARLDPAAIDDLREALPRFAHQPLAFLQESSSDKIQAWWHDEIRRDAADDSAIALVSSDSGKIDGLLVYNDSPWDSRIIGRRVGTIKHLATTAENASATRVLEELIRELIKQLAARGTDLVISKVTPNELNAMHVFKEHGFLLMDTLLDFVVDFSRETDVKPPRKIDNLNIRSAKPNDLSELVALTEQAFTDYIGRYHADPRIPREIATKIYTEWVRSSFEGWADWILVAEIDGETAGYGIWKKPSENALRHSLDIVHYNLAAIHPKFSGRGLYTALAFDGMRIARDFGRFVLGPVHVSNHPVQHALQKLGWRICGSRHSFHKWLTA